MKLGVVTGVYAGGVMVENSRETPGFSIAVSLSAGPDLSAFTPGTRVLVDELDGMPGEYVVVGQVDPTPPAKRWKAEVNLQAQPAGVAPAGHVWYYAHDNNAPFAGFSYNAYNNIGDAAWWPVDLDPGTWALDFWGKQNPAYGLATLALSTDGGTTWTTIGVFDFYSAADQPATFRYTNITVDRAGSALFRVTVTGRNASSTGSYAVPCWATFSRTA